MMTNTIRLRDVTLPDIGLPPVSTFSPPVLPRVTNLIGLYAFGGDVGVSARNHAVPSDPLAVRGTPEMVNAGVRITRDGFDTEFSEHGSLTAFFVARVEAPASLAEGQLLLTNYATGAEIGGDSFGFTYQASRPRFGIYTSAENGASSVRASRVTDEGMALGELALFVGRTKSTGECKVWAYQGEFSYISAESAAMTRAISDRPLGIGNRYGVGSNFGGEADLNMLAVYDAALSDGDVDDAVAAIRSHYARVGVAL